MLFQELEGIECWSLRDGVLWEQLRTGFTSLQSLPRAHPPGLTVSTCWFETDEGGLRSL